MDLKKSIKKAKRKQIILICALSIITTIIILGTIAFTLDKMATKNYKTLNETLFDYQKIASPNTQIDSQVISYSSIFGGEVVTNQSKNIEDLPVLGVMVTGQTKNLSQLKDKSFIRGSSIGATSEIVPYITPEN